LPFDEDSIGTRITRKDAESIFVSDEVRETDGMNFQSITGSGSYEIDFGDFERGSRKLAKYAAGR